MRTPSELPAIDFRAATRWSARLRSKTLRYAVAGFLLGLGLTLCGYLVDYHELYGRFPERWTAGLLSGLHAVTPVHYFTDLFAIFFAFTGALLGWIQDRVVCRADELERIVDQRTQALRRSERRYALAAAGANDGLWEWDLTTDRVYYSSRWMRMAGLPETQREDSPEAWFARVHPDDLAGLRVRLEGHLGGRQERFFAEYRLRQQSGQYRWMRVRGLADRDPEGKPVRLAGSQHDIDDARKMEEQLRYLAVYDEQTDLPNRTLFLDRVQQAMHRASVFRRRFAVLYLGLDRWSTVQEGHGREAADQALRAIGHRIWEAVQSVQEARVSGPVPGGSGNTLARVDGELFGVLLFEVRSVRDAVRVARRVLEKLESPFVLAGREVRISISIGIALGSDESEKAEDLARDAQAAMNRAQASGGSRYEVFDTAMVEAARDQLALETEMIRALDRQELVIWYQPIFRLKDSRLAGFEALLRWNHPRRGLVGPAAFIPLAEENGLIGRMTRWVFEESFRVVRSWMDRFPENAGARLNVNLSPRYLATSDLLDDLDRIREDTGAEPSRVHLEVTEGSFIDDRGRAAALLREAKKWGYTIAMDDFGTGYSSLSILHELPIDTLKIDRAFIARLADAPSARSTVETIVGLARTLRQKVVAEGIETEEQLRILRRLRCGFGQGFLLGKPMPLDQAERRFLQDRGESLSMGAG